MPVSRVRDALRCKTGANQLLPVEFALPAASRPEFCRLVTYAKSCSMTVYKKTQKGMNELLTRSPSIDTRLFNALVLVDGVRDSSEVIELAQAASLPVDALEILFHGGFIEKKFKGSAPAPVVQAQPPVQARPPPRQPDASSRLKGFNDLYAYLVEQTKTLLGLRGFVFQLRIERASTVDALRALIGPLSEAIAKRHGFSVSQDFRRESERLAVAAIAERNG
jgi:hypothetical protein